MTFQHVESIKHMCPGASEKENIQLYEAGRHRHHSPSVTPHAEDDVSTPTASPVNTIKEGNFFPLLDNDSLDNLPRHEKDVSLWKMRKLCFDLPFLL